MAPSTLGPWTGAACGLDSSPSLVVAFVKMPGNLDVEFSPRGIRQTLRVCQDAGDDIKTWIQRKRMLVDGAASCLESRGVVGHVG